MKEKNITCIICPVGCEITVQYDPEKIIDIKGATCGKGEEYVKKEIFNPERVLTSSVLVEGGELPLVSVRTDKAIPRELLKQVMEIINKKNIEAPVSIGEVIITSPCGLECNVVATKSVKKYE